MATPAPTQPEEKRGVASARRRRQLLLLVTEYQKLQAKFPSLRREIQGDIEGHLRQAERTRASDRAAVLMTLEQWQSEGLSVEEVIDDTGLSERTVRGVLDELQKTEPRLVGYRELAQDRERGRRTRIFFLLHTPPEGFRP